MSGLPETHTVLVLSAPRGLENTPDTNANYERIRAGVQLAHELAQSGGQFASCPVIISGHPKEPRLLRREVEQVCLETDIGPKLRLHFSAPHTVANAFFGLTEAEYTMRRFWRSEHPQQLVVHVVTSAWHLARVELVFMSVLELFRHWDQSWQMFGCRLEFHAAPVETSSHFAAECAAQEVGKLADTYRFMRGWRHSRHRFQRHVRDVRRALKKESSKLLEAEEPPVVATMPAQQDQDPSDHGFVACNTQRIPA